MRSSTANFNGRILTFRFSFGFTAGLSYYVLLDSGKLSTDDHQLCLVTALNLTFTNQLGVAVGTEFCNQESLAVTSTTFWTFSTGTVL